MVGRPREPARRPSTYLRMNRLAAWMACSNLRERLPCSKASGSQFTSPEARAQDSGKGRQEECQLSGGPGLERGR